MLAFRQAIAAKPAKFLAMEKKLTTAGLKIADHEPLKRNPRDFAAVDARVEHAIRMKNFLTRRPFPEALLHDGTKLTNAVADFARQALPLLTWGWEIIG